MLRIIGGKASGCRLTIPGIAQVRPATDRLRESLFAILNKDLEKKRVLDLFAGSGVMGLEAVSRGADHCTFVEKEEEALKILRQNVQAVGLPSKCTVICHDLSNSLRIEDSFEFVFLDPPFAFFKNKEGMDLLERLVKDLKHRLLASSGTIVMRNEDKDDKNAEAFLKILGCEPVLVRTYGRSCVKVFHP